MANKQAILENVGMYTSDELVEYIKQGVVTFEELCEETEGEFSASARKAVEQKMNGSESEEWDNARNSKNVEGIRRFISVYPSSKYVAEAKLLIDKLEASALRASIDDEWNATNKESIKDLKRFCELHPDDVHVKEAKRLINELRKEEFIGFDIEALVKRIKNLHNKHEEIYKTIVDFLDRNKISHADLLGMIREDHNVLSALVVDRLLENGYLDYDDFETIGINRDFIRHLVSGERPQGFLIPKKLEKINKLSTEVYFWGIPSSGKSCALGAILSVAGNGMVAKSMSKDNDCQGYGYMTRLATLFKSNRSVGTLPDSTSIYSTYEMGFDLEDQNGAVHPLTCIDLAGELVRCMYKYDAGEDMSEDQKDALDTLTKVLIDNRSRNRKIHFFVLEYGADDRKYEGLTQNVYLDGALRYIERSGIFKDDTDAIYLMITKVDKAHAGEGQLHPILREYINNTYGGFYNGLVKICKDCEINSGNVEIVPFSLGEVCFRDFCLFDGRAAANVVRKLLERSKGFKNGKLQKTLKIFKR
ncbi:hypothetical protein [uncultured Bacteroides sp.]|uniref:hypothetical protein n=1 Tax=uncultured Bacteroides sp. TaxID=162156 RepID=UPI002629B93B|nr:hypothetical protein [uncultured Bacteroides sp.]